MERTLSGLLAPFALCAALAACASPPPPATLYGKLGERAGIERLVDGLLHALADDERIAHHFAETDIARFRRLLVEQLCHVSDGPCVYSGDDMREAHRGHGISEGDFNALVEDLIDVMDANAVPLATQNRLLARLAPMHSDVVETRAVRAAPATPQSAPASPAE